MGDDSVRVADASAKTVGEVMVKRPKTLPFDATVAELRRLFENEHVRTALLVDGERFAGALEREDVPPDARDDDWARLYVRGSDTVRPDLTVADAVARMRAAGTKRLVVVGDDGTTLRGLLCLTSDLESLCVS